MNWYWKLMDEHPFVSYVVFIAAVFGAIFALYALVVVS